MGTRYIVDVPGGFAFVDIGCGKPTYGRVLYNDGNCLELALPKDRDLIRNVILRGEKCYAPSVLNLTQEEVVADV